MRRVGAFPNAMDSAAIELRPEFWQQGMQPQMLTEREYEIVATLIKVPLLATCQAERTWFPQTVSGATNCRRTLSGLVARGLIHRFETIAHPELPLTEPVWTWRPGQPDPPAGSIAYRLGVRWTEPLQPTVIYVATRRAAKLYGGVGGRLRSCVQVTHDIHVATVYLKFLQEQPWKASAWVSESAISSQFHNEKLPDAAIKGPDGELALAIEFGGSYPKPRVEKLHRSFSARNLPYELW